MSSSECFSPVDADSWGDGFSGCFDEIWPEFSQLRLEASPEPITKPLPDHNPSFIPTQPSPISPSAHELYPHPHPDPHTPSDFHGRPHQLDCQPIQYYIPFLNPRDSGPMLVPTTHQPSATLDAGHPLMHGGLQGCSYAVGSSPVYDTFNYSQDHSTCAQSHYNGSQVFIDQNKPYNPAMDTPYRQTQHALAGRSSSIPSELTSQPMVPRSPPTQVSPIRRNSRGMRSVTSSPYYHPIRTSSLPLEPTSPNETAIRTCQWMRDDGTVCGERITASIVSDHLITHGVKELAHDHRLPCRWLGCQLRGDKHTMKRESIVRHVREKHLGCKRASKQV